MASRIRYRFADFILSTGRRQLLREGRPLPLIPRYFDLLVLLVERRDTAVSRQEIFDRVWSDVIVSDGALSQAVRTLRRTLGDDPRSPIYIRTVSRHGYSFVFPEVVEEADERGNERELNEVDAFAGEARAEEIADSPGAGPTAASASLSTDDRVERLIDRLMRPSQTAEDVEEQRDAAEQLHLLGTGLAVARVKARAGHARALAILREARWSVPGAGPVPLAGDPEGVTAAGWLIRMRAAQALTMAERRWAGAALGAAIAGVLAGLVGGVALVASPGTMASGSAIGVLAGIGAVAGAVGASGVAAGIAAAEAVARSGRAIAIVAGGAAGGLLIGSIAHVIVRWTLDALFGLRVPTIGGPIEGIALGLAAGFGYAVTTRRAGGGGMATPAGAARWRVALAAATCCAVAGVLLAAQGRPLVGGLINGVAEASRGSQLALAPLGALIGDPSFGDSTKVLLAAFETAWFGFGLAWGLTRRPGR